MRSLALIGLVLSSCAVSQTPDPAPVDGRISGRVVNEDGKPVPGATVYVSQEASSLVDADSVVTLTMPQDDLISAESSSMESMRFMRGKRKTVTQTPPLSSTSR